MKLAVLTSTLLPLAFLAGVPSPSLASPETDAALAQAHHLAMVRRERALLRPAMRPAHNVARGRTTSSSSSSSSSKPNSVPLPLRKQSLPAKRRDGKMTARRNVAEFGPENLLALRNLPLPMQVRAATSQESSAAAAPEEDPDVEDDWDCEQDDLTEEESSYTTTSYLTTPYTPAAPDSSSSEYLTPSLTSTAEALKTTKTSSSSSRSSGLAPAPTQTYLRPASHFEKVLIPTTLLQTESASSPSTSSSSSSDSPKQPEDNSTDTVLTVVTKTEQALLTKTGSDKPKILIPTTHPSSSASSSSTKVAAPIRQASSFGLVDPINLANGSLTVAQGCTRFHTVLAGEVCLGIIEYSKDLGLTLEQLYDYNPAINSVCTNLEIGWGLCIAKATATPPQNPQKLLPSASSSSSSSSTITTTTKTKPKSTITSTLPPTTEVTTTTIIVDVTSTSTLPYISPTASA